MSTQKIRCNDIAYRKGFIEVTSEIHAAYINLEAWQVHPEVDIANIDVTDESFPDEGVTGNIELEMSVEVAECLIKALQAAIYKLKAGD